jgi:hypothetical protein
MKFTCPLCETTGNIPQDDIDQPVTRATCQNCSTILLINPETGKVDAHKSPLKDSPAFERSGNQSIDKSASVLSMRPRDRAAKDWTAVVVVAIIIIFLVFAGLFFTFKLDTM